jgi:hypothetical protein
VIEGVIKYERISDPVDQNLLSQNRKKKKRGIIYKHTKVNYGSGVLASSIQGSTVRSERNKATSG